jgi:hypothetical protein
MVVAGSLLGGLIAAIVLVAVPFAGARESAITGSLLLGFAFGWALLAFLSSRLTDRPRRWAVAPATAMVSPDSPCSPSLRTLARLLLSAGSGRPCCSGSPSG